MDRDEPQKKPISATDGKKTAGRSYSVKQTSRCDDDSRGPEAQQPPLKRQTRLGAKQANAIDTNTVDEYAPTKVALQNDLVLESLLRYMNRSDLLSCRAVNKMWQFEATKELRRRQLVIGFCIPSKGNQMSQNIAFQDICRRLSECRTPSLLSSFHVIADPLSDLRSAIVKSIFTTVGNQMKHLTLNLKYGCNTSSFKRRSFMTDLEDLLCRQAPNLEFLEIKFGLSLEWMIELKAFDSTDHHQNDAFDSTDHHQNDAFDSTDHHQNGNNKFQLLPHLKVFIVGGTPPPNFLREVINAAVNLRSFGGLWSAWRTYLMGAEGGTRIHQLKSLELVVDTGGILNRRFLEQMETFLAEHRQNLKLETFSHVVGLDYYTNSSALRTVNVVNQILECSSGSLQKLKIGPAKWFTDLLIIPRLPKLKEITFDCQWGSCGGLTGVGFFPRGFNMNTSFPNVSTMVVLRCTDIMFSGFDIRKKKTKIKTTKPVPSIRHITVIDGRNGNFVPSHLTVTDFRHVFPNIVSFSYVYSEKCNEV